MNTTNAHGYNVRNPRFNVKRIYSKLFADRLVPLSDGSVGLRGTINVEITDPGKDAFVQSGKDAFHRVPDLTPGEAQPGKDASWQSARTRVPDLSSTIPDTSCNPCLDFISSDDTIDRY